MVTQAAGSGASGNAALGTCTVVPATTLLQLMGGVQMADKIGMRETFLGDEFQNIFKIERGLLRFAQPGGGDGLQAREVVAGDGVSGIRRFIELEFAFRGRVE